MQQARGPISSVYFGREEAEQTPKASVLERRARGLLVLLGGHGRVVSKGQRPGLIGSPEEVKRWERKGEQEIVETLGGKVVKERREKRK